MSDFFHDLGSVSPFRLDALGLLTMLGADEMSREVGSLSRNNLVSWLPFLGGNVIPSNAFVEPLHSYTLYNISDAVQSTTLSGWFSRWLLAQKPSLNTTTFTWSFRSQPCHRDFRVLLEDFRAIIIGLSIDLAIIVLSYLVEDYYGLASALTMTTGILVRQYLVAQNRDAVDRAAADTSVFSNDPVRTFVLLANGKAVTVIAPRNIIINCFLSTPKPGNPVYYGIARAFGWLAFTGFIVTIGQATFVVQTAIVLVTVLATVFTAFGIGSTKDIIGKNLQVARLELPNSNGRRGEAYAMLNLTKEEEDTMVDWFLFPQRRNKQWWDKYREYRTTGGQAITVHGNLAKDGDLTLSEKDSQETLRVDTRC